MNKPATVIGRGLKALGGAPSPQPADPTAFMTVMPGRLPAGQEEAFLASARIAHPHNREEADIILYHFLRDVLEPDMFYSVQAFPSDAALQSHMFAPSHVQRMRETHAAGYRQSTGDRFQLAGWQELRDDDLAGEAAGWPASAAAGDAPGAMLVLCGPAPAPDVLSSWLRTHGATIRQDPQTITYVLAYDGTDPSRVCLIHATSKAPSDSTSNARLALAPDGFSPDEGARLDLAAWTRKEAIDFDYELGKVK